MRKEEFYDFYDRTSLKSYNLDKNIQDQLNALSGLDVFTRKHCENVATLTCRICEYLHCSKGFTEYCTICAYIHDLGKLFIPSSILQKPGDLTAEEFEIMKTHTTIGYNMCIKDEKLRPYAAGALYHHESLDGSGYPNGLHKKDIPYEGQIIRVADEYDAIVSRRQYKSHIGISDTLKILIEHSNSGKVNPIIVKALIKVVLDDVAYEISCTQNYVNYLQDNIKRFKTINKYYEKMITAKTDNKKVYFRQYIEMYFEKGETLDNFKEVEQAYISAYNNRQAIIDNLYNEIKIIKKIKV